MTQDGSNLFNARTLSKMSAEIEPTPEQVSSAEEWLGLLEAGALHKERKNYFRFGLLVLHGILGYSVTRELNFEEGNVEFSFRRSDNTGGVCIEVKGEETRDLFASQHREKPEHKTPIKQTWDYMGAGNFEYGIATNYRQFVLIDKAQGYARHHLFDFLDIRVDKSKLKQFIAVFSRGNILEGSFIPSLYRESQVEERAFTTEFYQLFHRIRLRLIGEFEAAGGTSKEDALHYAQLILNRLVFVFFASGTGKLKRRLFAESILKSLHPDLVSPVIS